MQLYGTAVSSGIRGSRPTLPGDAHDGPRIRGARSSDDAAARATRAARPAPPTRTEGGALTQCFPASRGISVCGCSSCAPGVALRARRRRPGSSVRAVSNNATATRSGSGAVPVAGRGRVASRATEHCKFDSAQVPSCVNKCIS